MRRQPRTRTAALLACALGLLAPEHARAHAPLARGVVLGPSGDASALLAPGFGLLLPHGSGGFAYACDALLGVAGRQGAAGVVPLADGSLLIGGEGGLARLNASGCPDSDALSPPLQPVLALAGAGTPQVIHAVQGGELPALWRSDDGGEHFERVAALPAGAAVDSLVAASDAPQVVYMTRPGGAGTELIVVRPDAGAAGGELEVHAQAQPLRLLHAGAQLWALGSDPDTREALLLRAAAPTGPFEEVQRVRFFGGFALHEATGSLWLADEAGGLRRSDDAGDSFATVSELAASCLQVGQDGALWACTPGTPQQPALMVSRDGGERFDPVLALADVQQLVQCAPQAQAGELCALAWTEWEADVLGRSSDLPGTDGSVLASDAGVIARDDGDAGAAGTRADARGADQGRGADGPSRVTTGSTAAASGCAVSAARRDSAERTPGAALWSLLALAFALVLVLRSRRRLLRRASRYCSAAPPRHSQLRPSASTRVADTASLRTPLSSIR